MKKLIFIFLFFIPGYISYCQDLHYDEYSYTQFFEMINGEEDSIFSLSDAVIYFDEDTDSLFQQESNSYINTDESVGTRKKTLVVDKEIDLDNVHFKTSWHDQGGIETGVINNVQFNKDVSIDNVINVHIFDCEFRGRLSSRNGDKVIQASKELDYNLNTVQFLVSKSKLRRGARVSYGISGESASFRIGFSSNEVWSDTLIQHRMDFFMFGRNIFQMWMEDNVFHGSGVVEFRSIANGMNDINNNTFEGSPSIYISGNTGFDHVSINDNHFQDHVFLEIDKLQAQYLISYQQFDGKMITNGVWDQYAFEEGLSAPNSTQNRLLPSASQLNDYKERYLIEDSKAHLGDKALRSLFHNYFKSKFDNESANLVYIEIKDLETKRMAHMYHKNPSFDTYFTWKTNQFLKIFSEYGTRPANAVIFSIKVIFVFALFYLFFPNSWDQLGRHRLSHRFDFFQKYLRRKEGMHDIFLEGKMAQLSSYEDFKKQIDDGSLELPGFFVAMAKPIYRVSVVGTRLTANFLKGVDVLEGRWQDLSPAQKRLKSFQVGLILCVGLLYDLTIKLLNALMLSINTFTTLGFGEIPIKGLPRYLAIIQGFIGWFMLTIFSVSLISQLLN